MLEESAIYLAEDKGSSLVLKEAIWNLPDEILPVVLLSITGFRQIEIAEIMQVSRTTVWSRKNQGLQLLKITLGV